MDPTTLAAPTSNDDILSLLLELEASLSSDQNVILAGSIQALEQTFAEQAALQKKLAALLVSIVNLPGVTLATSQAAARVLHLGRVQLALVTRARRHLAAIANLAGASRGYALAASGATCNAVPIDAAKGEFLCRA
ncbi:MAG TPA: hypothetical protein VKV39_16870 [Candidatus Sulfotelmatobacter sp.]|nr:hypothetical protein [Candidatus Sulfotelmatobacter sp.]